MRRGPIAKRGEDLIMNALHADLEADGLRHVLEFWILLVSELDVCAVSSDCSHGF